MPQIPIIMPQLGESIAEAVIVSFLVQPGDTVEADQDLIEVETNKATMNVPSTCRGKVEKFLVNLNESYPVGAVLGYLEVSAGDAARVGLDAPVPEQNGEPESTKSGFPENVSSGDTKKYVRPTVRGLPVPANAAGAGYISPRMKARMAELGLHAADLAGVAGSGAAGRVTIQDFEKFIANLERHKLTQASSMRVSVADAMRRSWTRPLAHVGNPARPCARCARSRWRSRRTARRREDWSATRSCTPRRSTSDSRWKLRMVFWFRSFAMPTSVC
jgi:pyruvate/2-oxoglutarate dehydrogenase complex dihydrolipoamide acyltransferase (E2) component